MKAERRPAKREKITWKPGGVATGGEGEGVADAVAGEGGDGDGAGVREHERGDLALKGRVRNQW